MDKTEKQTIWVQEKEISFSPGDTVADIPGLLEQTRTDGLVVEDEDGLPLGAGSKLVSGGRLHLRERTEDEKCFHGFCVLSVAETKDEARRHMAGAATQFDIVYATPKGIYDELRVKSRNWSPLLVVITLDGALKVDWVSYRDLLLEQKLLYLIGDPCRTEDSGLVCQRMGFWASEIIEPNEEGLNRLWANIRRHAAETTVSK